MELDWDLKWDELSEHWNNLMPPAVPSQEDIINFIELAQAADKNSGAALVLGSTPGLRAALSRQPAVNRLYCVDVNAKAYRKLPKAIVDTDEELINIDWLDMSRALPQTQIDIIAGDKAIDNMPLDRWSAFLTACRDVLAPQGRLLLHVGFPDPQVLRLSPIDLVRENHWLVQQKKLERTAGLSALWEDLLSHSAQYDPGYLSLERYKDIWEQLPCDQATFFRDMADTHINKWTNKWANFDRTLLLKMAEKAGLAFVAERTASDYHKSVNQPILSFRRAGKA